jgi:hypothetical protein
LTSRKPPGFDLQAQSPGRPFWRLSVDSAASTASRGSPDKATRTSLCLSPLSASRALTLSASSRITSSPVSSTGHVTGPQSLPAAAPTGASLVRGAAGHARRIPACSKTPISTGRLRGSTAEQEATISSASGDRPVPATKPHGPPKPASAIRLVSETQPIWQRPASAMPSRSAVALPGGRISMLTESDEMLRARMRDLKSLRCGLTMDLRDTAKRIAARTEMLRLKVASHQHR